MSETRRTFLARTGAAITAATTATAGCLGSSDDSGSEAEDSNSTPDGGGGGSDSSEAETTESGPTEIDLESSLNNNHEDGVDVLEHTAYRGSGSLAFEIVIEITDHSKMIGPFEVGATVYDSDDVELGSNITMVEEYDTGDKIQKRVEVSSADPDAAARYTVDIDN